MKRLLFLFAALVALFEASAARIDTVAVHSTAMQRELSALVIVPEAAAEKPMPVLYLLHGYGGDAYQWQGITDLRPLAERHGMIIVCPDGEKSWYWDSPLKPEVRFETFVGEELPAWVDAHYPTVARREGRAITGLSMGGHGALWLAIRHSNTFGAAGATAGGVDIRPFPEAWRMHEQLGPLKKNRKRWDRYTVINEVERLQNGELALVIDCGYGDFFYEVNQNLHKKLRKRGIDHDFYVRPGRHHSSYWAVSLPYQMLFFERYFRSENH